MLKLPMTHVMHVSRLVLSGHFLGQQTRHFRTTTDHFIAGDNRVSPSAAAVTDLLVCGSLYRISTFCVLMRINVLLKLSTSRGENINERQGVLCGSARWQISSSWTAVDSTATCTARDAAARPPANFHAVKNESKIHTS